MRENRDIAMDAWEALQVNKVNWSEIRSLIKKHNLGLSKIVDEWAPPEKEYYFYRASYRYGDKIHDNGKLNLPLKNGEVVPLNDPLIPNSLQNELSYSSFPIGIILKNTTEVFMPLSNKIMSLAIFGQGVPLGLLETLEAKKSCCLRNVWTITAGARSIFMLPKISDKVSHDRMQKALGMLAHVPRRLIDHAEVFQAIDRAGEGDWTVDILFFSKKWFEKNESSYNWLRFYHYLHEYLFAYTGFSRNKPTFDVLWHYFSDELTKKKKKPNAYILETVKHLTTMALGAVPGFSVATAENLVAPVSKIQDAYMNTYDLKYAPTIMAPHHFSINENTPAYYSLCHPTMLNTTPRSREPESLISDLFQLKSLINDFKIALHNDHLKLESTILKDILESAQFNFHHTHPNETYGILDTKNLPALDPALALYGTHEHTLASASNFLRSCVTISTKTDTSTSETNRIPLA